MAKTKKPTAKKGSRVTPRKDARKMNRDYMKDTFKLYDQGNELVGRFEVGYAEIAQRGDVPAEVLGKMKAFIDKHKHSFGELVKAQDATALQVETLLDNISLKWADIELEVTAGQLELHQRINEWTGKFAEIMTEAAELAHELPDTAPETEKVPASEFIEGRQSARGETVVYQPADESPYVADASEVQPIEATEGGLFVQGEDGEKKRLVNVDGETKEVDKATLVLPKEETVVERDGSVAHVDENGNLKSLMA